MSPTAPEAQQEEVLLGRFDVDLTDLARRANDDVLQLVVEEEEKKKNCATARSWQELQLAKCTMFRETERENGFLAKSTFMMDYPRWDVADGGLIWPL